jgi:ABC-type glycerol-3-phosphate transport system permease component
LAENVTELGPGLPATRERARRRRGNPVGAWGKYVVLALFAFITLYPMLLVVSTAVRDPLDVTADPFDLFTSIRLENLREAWTDGLFGEYLWNTVIATVPTVIATVVLSVVAGYAFARLQFPGRNLLFYLLMFGLMIPFTGIMIPLYYQLRDMQLLDTWWAVILPLTAGATGIGVPFGVFLMRSFFQSLPPELAEAAKVDGTSEFGVFRHVMLPLARSGASVLAVFTFIQAWNTFFLPLIYLQGEEHRLLATGLYQFAGGRTAEIELLAAGALITILPVLVVFMLFQRQFIRGLSAGAVKG